MEIKYQVFVSSTYRDLKDERQEVIQALLELDCIPVGMELFPAADDDQWTLIQRLIDDCDYYILIIGGRYGSVNSEGISYTQMEYEYALKKGIPIISFLHKEPDNIPVGKSESDKELKQKLDDFKALAQQKMCKYYESAVDLGSIVSRSLVRLIKDKPQPGWVKATYIPSEESTKELLELTKQNELLKAELEKTKTNAPEGTEDLSQGDDKVELTYSVKAQGNWEVGSVTYEYEISLSWNELFAEISPIMIDESPESPIRAKINGIIFSREYDELAKEFKKAKRVPNDFKINDNDFQTIKIQFRALNLITESIKKRGVHDKATYWKLTPFGDNMMTRLRAIRK
jgi:hypothetical protein